MKKSAVIAAFVILASALLVLRFGIIFSAHMIMKESADAYTEETVLSDDGKFRLCTHKFKEHNVTYISFDVEEVSGDSIVFQCEDKYRAYDFKGVEWEDLNIVVKSGDIGNAEYIYEDGMWRKKSNDKYNIN